MYTKGKRIEDFEEFMALIRIESPFMFNHKFLAADSIEQWGVAQVKNAIKNGMLYVAIKEEEDL